MTEPLRTGSVNHQGAECAPSGMVCTIRRLEEFTNKLGAENSDAGHPLPNMLGIAISVSSAVGYYFSPPCADGRGNATHASGPVLTPSNLRRPFHVRYDPMANIRRGGHSVEFYLDDLTYTARRHAAERPPFRKQTSVEAPYSLEQGGRPY